MGIRKAHRDELPPGFERLLVERAAHADGVLQTELNREFGADRRWMALLQELGREHGYYRATMMRDGKGMRFHLIR